MSTRPTARFRIAPAPVGLHRVQDLLNTRALAAKGFPDLLADGVAASQSLDADLTDADARELRGLRSALEELIAGTSPSINPVGAELSVDATGVVRLSPSGGGWEYVASQVWAEVLLAQQTDTWRRLKRCRNELCGTAFYDRSRNNSGVWHDVKTCGNTANLRASRARRRSE